MPRQTRFENMKKLLIKMKNINNIKFLAFARSIYFICILSMLIISTPTTVFAAAKTSTPSATPVSKEVQNKIDDLKERLATKVAELRKTVPKAIFGTVTQVSLSSVTVDATQKAYKIELTDSIKVAQMLKAKRTALTTEDLAKTDVITIFGEYDETLDILQAKSIFIEAAKLPVRLHGTISAVDKKNNSFTLKGVDEASYTIDVEAATKNSLWSREKGIEKGGFSKLEPGMYVTVVGTEDAKQPDRYSAMRILTFKLDNSNSSALGATTTASPSATPTQAKTSTTPKATLKPSATPKSSPTPKATVKPTVGP